MHNPKFMHIVSTLLMTMLALLLLFLVIKGAPAFMRIWRADF